MTYQTLAQVYDGLMGDYDYDLVYQFIKDQVGFGKESLEMACGTGSLTLRLLERGPVTAFDLSQEMLEIARDKIGYNPRLVLLNQDLRNFQMTQAYDRVFCFCDSLNYLTRPQDLLAAFKRVQAHLTPGGIFAFDVNTSYKYQAMGDQVFLQEDDQALALWQNTYHEATRLNDYNLTLFIAEGDLYRRADEFHTQRAYDQDEIEDLLDQGGLAPLAFYHGYSAEPARKDTRRLVCLASLKEMR